MFGGVPPSSARRTSSAFAASTARARREQAVGHRQQGLVLLRARVASASPWLASRARRAASRTSC